jgi:hypothetical protein
MVEGGGGEGMAVDTAHIQCARPLSELKRQTQHCKRRSHGLRQLLIMLMSNTEVQLELCEPARHF